jgi:hypothetical protein
MTHEEFIKRKEETYARLLARTVDASLDEAFRQAQKFNDEFIAERKADERERLWKAVQEASRT